MNALVSYLNTVPLAGLMLVVTGGYLLGRLSWRGLALGPAGGTLAVALLLGAQGLSFRGFYGVDDPKLTLGAFGFALFIYSIGFEAGPRFFDSVRGGSGWKFAAVGALVNALALGVAVLSGWLLGLDGAVVTGLLAGALTSAPAYAAAAEISRDPTLLAVTFVVAYPLGLVGTVLLVQFLPRWMGDDLSRGTRAADDEPRARRSPELTRAFEVQEEPVIGSTLAQLDLTHRTGCYVTRVHRGADFFQPDAGTLLQEGDHLMAKGRLEELRAFERTVGPEVFDDELRANIPSPRAVQVTAAPAIGKTLAQLELLRRYRCLVTEVLRGDVTLEPEAELRLLRDDVVLVSGKRDQVRAVAALLGRFERSTQETDIAIYAGGILLGLLLGQLPGAAFGVPFQLGAAVGLLTVGILLGRFRRIGPFSAHVPTAARRLVRDLGILLFVAETGVRAGGSSLGVLRPVLGEVLGATALTVTLSVTLAVVLGRRLLRLSPIDAWGSTAGGMTSSAALLTLRTASDSNEAAISYAAAYAVGSVLAALVGQLASLLG